MTSKQRRFVQQYLIDLNAKQAAIRAGYSPKTAEQIGYQLLHKTSVAEAIATAQGEMAEKLGVTAERIVAELAKLGFSNMQDYVGVSQDGRPFIDLSAVDREKWAAVGELTVEHFTKRGESEGDDSRVVEKVKFKLLDKRAALVDLGKHLGMFVDKHETIITERMVVQGPEPTDSADDWAGKHGPH